uniref:histone-lysine N-methyltransferase Smyd1-like n=1 Tax=Myxine glutinosa TaxID=7769 RepID=UPI00358E3E85
MDVQIMEQQQVRVAELKDKGLGLVAAQSFQPSDVVFAEQAFAAVPFSSIAAGKTCNSCFRSGWNLIPCRQCELAWYCNRTCLREARSVHGSECKDLLRTYHVNDTVRLAAQVLKRVARDGVAVADRDLVTIDGLQPHAERLSQDLQAILKAELSDCLRFCPKAAENFDENFIEHVLCVIHEYSLLLHDQSGMKPVGMGLFLLASLLNHSCAPNCCIVFNNGKYEANNTMYHSPARLEVRALFPIKENDELTISYVCFLFSGEERNTFLKEHFSIDCSCLCCANNFAGDPFSATKVTGPELEEVIIFSTSALMTIHGMLLQELWEQAWELCLETLAKQEGVLGVTHAYRLCVLNAALSAACHLSTDKALALVTQATNAFRKLGLSWAPKVVSVFMKAAALVCISGDLKEGHGLLCEVLSVLLSTHGALHPRTKHVQALCWGLERKMKIPGHSVRIQGLPDQDGELMSEALKVSQQPPEKTIFCKIY